jgi:hypothetical protein
VTDPRTASFREFADIAKVKPSYVTELRRDGRLVLTEDRKRVLVDESLQLMRDTADPARRGVALRHAAERGAPSASIGAEKPDASSTETAEDEAGAADAAIESPNDSHARRRAKALADKEEALAAQAIRDYNQSMGKLMDVADVEEAIAQAGTIFRKALERLPDTLAPQLAAVVDEGRIRALLTDELHHVLTELGREFSGIARREVIAA